MNIDGPIFPQLLNAVKGVNDRYENNLPNWFAVINLGVSQRDTHLQPFVYLGRSKYSEQPVDRILCRGWSGGLSVLVDEPIALARFRGPKVAFDH